MAKSSKGYFGLGFIISLILALIPFTNVIFGIVIRAQNKNILGVVLNIILCPLFYLIDLFCIIFAQKITVLA